MENGTVKWFSTEKGYGFIEYNDGEDLFVHFTGIEREDFKTLSEGQHISFIVLEDTRVLEATQLKKKKKE